MYRVTLGPYAYMGRFTDFMGVTVGFRPHVPFMRHVSPAGEATYGVICSPARRR